MKAEKEGRKYRKCKETREAKRGKNYKEITTWYHYKNFYLKLLLRF